MSQTDHFTLIGQVLKSNGADGQLLVSLRNIDADDISEKEPVFIFIDELPVPYFMHIDARRGNNKVLARLTDVENLDDAMELYGKNLYLKSVGEDITNEGEDLVGWTVLDENGACAGTVRSFEDIPGNPCIEILTEGSQAANVLLPLNEELIIDVDEQNRRISMIIPQGLLPQSSQ